jgi:hypothetical protein
MVRLTRILMVCLSLLFKCHAATEPHRVGVDVGKDFPLRARDETALLEHRLLIGGQAKGGRSDYTDAALAAALTSARRLFTVETPEPGRIATLTEPGGDVLTAGWAPTRSSGPLRPVLLWDDPNWETVIFECLAGQILSPQSLQKLSEDLLRFDDDLFAGAKMYLRLPPPANGRVMVGFSQKSNVIMRQFEFGPQVKFAGVLHGKYAYLSVSFTSRMGSYPSQFKGIPERFPPLEARIGAWPTRHLAEELMRPAEAPLPSGPNFVADPGSSGKRESVLVRELMTRSDFGPGDLKILLSQSNACASPYLPGLLLKAAATAHRREEFAAAFDEHLKSQHRCPK